MAIDRNERAAKNQSLFREVNQRVVELEQEQALDGRRPDFEVLCECANADCHEFITVRAEEFQEVRRSSIRFLIRAGHEWTDVERVVNQNDGYIVVEKFGETATIAAELDRSDSW
jgi:hypothetical protein